METNPTMPRRIIRFLLTDPPRPLGRSLALAGLSLLLASALWLPLVHLFFQPAPLPPRDDTSSLPSIAEPLARRHTELWTVPELMKRERERMRGSNAEWDFMGRSFLVWGLADLCLRRPSRKAELLPVMDRVIEDTLAVEKEKGIYHFLMGYARENPFINEKKRSVFVDGEIALMLAVRRIVEEKPAYGPRLARRIALLEEQMKAGPVLCGECYPDECWTFCNCVALAAMAACDYLDKSDHRPFFRQWVARAREKLVHQKSGILVSSFTLGGMAIDGPEGSTIWLAAHCLRLVDEEFAAEQYRLAREQLGARLLGFGWAREWPDSWRGPNDVDSGPVVPILDVSAGSSGLAFVGARSFDDRAYFRSLEATLWFAAFPVEEDGKLRFSASNQVGDAVLFYASVLGPVWKRILDEKERR